MNESELKAKMEAQEKIIKMLAKGCDMPEDDMAMLWVTSGAAEEFADAWDKGETE